MDVGKDLEVRVEQSLKQSNHHYRRIKTRMSGMKNDNEIADFYVVVNGTLIYLEVKSTKGSSFPFGMIRTNQLVGLWEADKFKDVTGGFLVETRANGNLYYVPIEVVDAYIKAGSRSISAIDLQYYVNIENISLDNIEESLSIIAKKWGG